MIAVIKIKIKVFPYNTAIENANQMIAVIKIKINTFFIVKLFHMQDLNKKQFNNNLWKYSEKFWRISKYFRTFGEVNTLHLDLVTVFSHHNNWERKPNDWNKD